MTEAAPIELPELPALVTGTVSHVRLVGVRHRLRHKVYQWLVDVDNLPSDRWPVRAFTRFDASDHIGDPDASIGHNLRGFCAAQGIDVSEHRIIMLANARVLGHIFDPLSVFWVIAPDSSLTCVVAEVHNTYGERHAYLIHPDRDGRAHVDKEFYVSPFFEVDGSYDLLFRLTPRIVHSSITLRRSGNAAFTASFVGTSESYKLGRLIRLLVRHPLMTWQVSGLIRVHGIWLWLRRQPIRPRPTHYPQEGTS